MTAPRQLTDLLVAWRAGDAAIADVINEEIYSTLKRMARSRLRDARPATLNPTALVHEAVLRLIDADVDFNSRAHFFALAALQMRSVLVDAARRRGAEKRGANALAVTLDDAVAALVDGEDAFLELHQALLDLAKDDQRTARVLELTYFGGLSAAQVGEVVGISVATVERDLAFGRAWLRKELAA